MGRKGSARGPFVGRCFLAGPLRSDARIDASLCREAFSPSLVRMHIGLPALQLRFLVTSCLAGVCVTALAVGWRVLVRPSNILTRLGCGRLAATWKLCRWRSLLPCSPWQRYRFRSGHRSHCSLASSARAASPCCLLQRSWAELARQGARVAELEESSAQE